MLQAQCENFFKKVLEGRTQICCRPVFFRPEANLAPLQIDVLPCQARKIAEPLAGVEAERSHRPNRGGRREHEASRARPRFRQSDVSAVNVVCTVETRDRAHLDELLARLQERGVTISGAR